MTTINQTYAEPRAITLRVANILERVAVRIRADYTWRKHYRRTYRELAGLEDRELHDLGLSRFDIGRISAEAAGDAVKRASLS